jgi:hypothetical protein
MLAVRQNKTQAICLAQAPLARLRTFFWTHVSLPLKKFILRGKRFIWAGPAGRFAAPRLTCTQ